MNPLLSWLAHYGLHSSLLLAAAWLVMRTGRPRSARAQEVLWRVALVGGIVTASLQSAGTVRSRTGHVALPAAATASLQVASPALVALPQVAPTDSIAQHRRPASLQRAAQSELPVSADSSLVLPLAAGLLGLLVFLCLPWIGLRRLGRRKEILEGPVREEMSDLLEQSGVRRRVRLTIASRLTVPVAFGVLRPEISVPERVQALPRAQLRALLAHELAHLVRLDPAWLWLQAGIAQVFFLQPLNRLACARLSDLAEQQCDDWATARTKDPYALARCLTEVAGWLRAGPALAVCAMTQKSSGLNKRINRILEVSSPKDPSYATLGLLGVGLVLGASFGLPAYGNAPEPPSTERVHAGRTSIEHLRLRTLQRELERIHTELIRLQSLATGPDSAELASDLVERAGRLAAQVAKLARSTADPVSNQPLSDTTSR